MNSSNSTRDELTHWTKLFWDLDNRKWKYYLGPVDEAGVADCPPQPLLLEELDWANRHERYPKKSGQKIAFAFLVGDSFDPILQSIQAYQPDRLVPVVCEFYGSREPDENGPSWHINGEYQWGELKKIIHRLSKTTGKQINVEDPKRYVKDKPRDVFDYLREQLKSELQQTSEWDVYVDITGAKKTMVAGAFLYAAYTGTKICYVDFDDYDTIARRPYGFSCRFAEVDNLYTSLHLREWEQVQQLYTLYNFNSALKVMEGLIKDKDVPDKQKSTCQHLFNFIEACNEWENGQYHTASNLLKPLPGAVKDLAPGAIAILAGLWPDEDGQMPRCGPVDAFLLDPRAVSVFAQDEISRCKRLAGITRNKCSETRQDSRSAFMRAYSVHETLLKARIAALYQQKKFFYKPDGEAPQCFEDLEDDTYQAIWKDLGQCQAGPAIKLLNKVNPYRLGWNRELYTNHGKLLKGLVYRSNPARIIKFPEKIDLPQLYQYRNLIIHTYAATQSGKDGEAIEVAEANLNEYLTNWSGGEDASNQATDRPIWDQLTKACGADDFLIEVSKTTR